MSDNQELLQRRKIVDRERGVEYGRKAWRPGLMTYLRSGSWSGSELELAFEVVLSIGLDAGAAQTPIQDRGAFFKGMMIGFDTAEREHGALAVSHQWSADCDLSSRWGLCEYCQAYAQAMADSRKDKTRWTQEMADPARQFVLLTMVHTRNCSVVAREVHTAEQRMTTLTPHQARHGGDWVRWPHLADRAQAVAAGRRRCSKCAPDLPERPTRGPVKGPDGRYTAIDE